MVQCDMKVKVAVASRVGNRVFDFIILYSAVLGHDS